MGVVQEHPLRVQVDSTRERLRRAPVEQRADLVDAVRAVRIPRVVAGSVTVPQQVLQHDPQAVGQVGGRQVGQPVDAEGGTADGEGAGGAERVMAREDHQAASVWSRSDGTPQDAASSCSSATSSPGRPTVPSPGCRWW
jgi:hypothetical protein